MNDQARYVIEISPYKEEGNKTVYYIYMYNENGTRIEGTEGWASAKDAWAQLKPFRDKAKQKTGEEPLVLNFSNYIPPWYKGPLAAPRTQTAQK